jgi:multicomponent Na+:H+ antiporter subunit G
VTIVGGVLIGTGVVLILLAGIGIVRLPDVLTRASAATKAAGLGVALVLAGVAFVIGTPEAAIKLGAAVVLQFLTAPVAGHVMGRGAYRSGAPLWQGTEVDELRNYYEQHPDGR